ncbi:MAG: hypothetical protein OQK82_05445, partial [Candidatus Pacearchaeota archaeon]|nr:hypothetical protein [Candidatus Pacearchaeota archaeon]
MDSWKSEIKRQMSETKGQKLTIKNQKRGQEEMVGFGLIIIIVAVILLVFLSIALSGRDNETVKSYEVESFIQAYLQHTSDCRKSDNLEYLSVQSLIFSCDSGTSCLDGRKACDALNETTSKVLDEYWRYGENRPIKGRILDILSEENTL